MAVVWRRADRLAVVGEGDRVALVKLAAPWEPPRILDGSAAAIWREVDGTSTSEAIATRVAARYESTPDSLIGEVAGFLSLLEREGLLTVDR